MMATTVGEVMNREVFSVRANDEVATVRKALVTLDITAAPVIDAEGRAIGVVSLRDLVDPTPASTVAECMSTPVVSVLPDELIGRAARRLAQTGYHHLIVVAKDGRVAGFVSSLDLLRGILGVAARHPAGFPHLDART